MSIQLSEQQLLSAKEGMPVRFHEMDADFVVVRADLFDRIQAIFEQNMIDDGSALVNEVMADDDLGDPLLETYQSYHKNPA